MNTFSVIIRLLFLRPEVLGNFVGLDGLMLKDINDLKIKDGERISNFKRAFNIQHCLTRKDDTIPERLLKETTKSGAVNDLNAMLPEYYRLKGWDEDAAKPKPKKLSDLELEDVRVDLWGEVKAN